MSEQFIFFCTNVGNENLLKEEIRSFYPSFNLSYSRKGFITYKNSGIQYDTETISQLEVTFSTRSGLCLGKATPENVLEVMTDSCNKIGINLEKVIIHSFSINTDYSLDHEEVFSKEVNNYSAINKTVIDVITLGDKEVWLGLHKVAKDTTSFPNSVVEIEIPRKSPSRSYLKIAEACELYHVKFDKRDLWLDFGSAPGGASFYILQNGCKVWGIDTAKMSESILAETRFTHIQKPVQDLSQEELPDKDIAWVHVDLNINPKQAIKEVLRLIKKYNHSLKGLVFNIQMIKLDHVKNIEIFEDQFYDWGFNRVSSHQVPSHKNEYVVIAKRH